jgi:hypothetical protein
MSDIGQHLILQWRNRFETLSKHSSRLIRWPVQSLEGRMKRREFIAIAGGAAITWPLAARAQQPAMSRIGVVMAFKESDPLAQSLVAAFRQELQKLGWTQGRNIAIDVRYATDDRNQVRALAVELMGLKPDHAGSRRARQCRLPESG